MGGNKTLTALVGGLMCLAPACTDSSDPGGEGGSGVANDPTDGPDSGSDDTGDEDAATIQVRGFVGEWIDGYPPLEGVTVSIVDHEEIPPVVTDAEGSYVFPEVPAGAEIIVYAEGDDDRHPAASRTWALGDSDVTIYPLYLFDRSASAFLAQEAGFPYDGSRGVIAGGVWKVSDDVLLDAQVALNPEAGDLVYMGAGHIPDPEAVGITPNGTFAIWNVDIGEYELTASHPDVARCWAEGPDQPEAVRVRTFPDTLTLSMGFTCD